MAARPSDAVPAADWASAHDELVDLLRTLIRIPSVNPPPEPGDGELRAAQAVAAALVDVGVEAEIHEPTAGRGSVTARLRGDGTGGEPLLLLSHLDVVPAPPELWTHDPFGADVADGYVWGRGAVDMKGMVAMEVAVIRRLAAEARAAGRDPATDPIPGLRRDVLFAVTADEEAGGIHGAGWIVEQRPDLLQAVGALNECGGVSVDFGGKRFYPIGVAEKGYANFRIVVHGTWGHGSMPRADNAAVRAAAIVTRLAEPGPTRLTPAMATFFDVVAGEIGGADRRPRPTDRLGRWQRPSETAIARVCDEMYGRAVRALLARHGVAERHPGRGQVQRDPGRRRDPGRLPDAAGHRRGGDAGRASAARWARSSGRIATSRSSARCHPSTRRSTRTSIERSSRRSAITIRMASRCRSWPRSPRMPSTRSGWASRPTASRRCDSNPSERFLERFHGVDERVGVDALRFGLPVLYDVVRRFCG